LGQSAAGRCRRCAGPKIDDHCGIGNGGNGIAFGISSCRIGIERRMIRQVAQIDEHTRHAGEHLAIFDQGVEIADIGEGQSQMVSDLGDAGLKSKRCIPRTALRLKCRRAASA
jgi:hypothetical protein